MRSIKRGQISIGAARAEDRAPSHDGEYLSVYYKHGGDWIIESNAGVVLTACNVSAMLDAAADDGDGAAYDEISRWQAEADAIVDTDSGEDWDRERMGSASREVAEEFGWLRRLDR
jgi:hypothetical protein